MRRPSPHSADWNHKFTPDPWRPSSPLFPSLGIRYTQRPERAILFTIEAWDVNCSSHIVTRFTEAEIEQTLATVQAKIAELEAENARLRALIGQPYSTR
jgi:hypothetical protein